MSTRELTEEELVRWGEELGRSLNAPRVIALSGELGAGKTTLTQAICRGLGVRDEVTSPTFALVHVYDAGKSVVHHVDLYRLNGPRDLQNIGWDDMFRSDSIVIVEWPERAGELVPSDATRIELQLIAGEQAKRRVVVTAPAGAVA